jgi:site-specific DNA-cytosine methylase
MLWFTKSRRAQSVDDYETWIAGGVMPTLNAFDNGDVRTTILIIDGTRVGDVRVYEDQVMQTVISRWGTGGGNVPAIFPIQDGREMEKKQNGLGIGKEDDPSYTLDRTGAQSVAIAIQGNMIGRADTAGPQGKGFTKEGDPMFTLTKTDIHAVCFDEWNDGTISDQHNTLRAGGKHSTGTIQGSTVRRLTPVETERLQGFPDDWTDRQADSHRYKQMGNAVTVNVARWIGKRL